MQSKMELAIKGTYRTIRRGLVAGNWDQVETVFSGFCASHRESIPEWLEDEYVFTAMKLWSAGRLAELLRHFATFFERALGPGTLYREDDAAPLSDAAMLTAC